MDGIHPDNGGTKRRKVKSLHLKKYDQKNLPPLSSSVRKFITGKEKRIRS
jgi:hypothetical protein